MLLSTVAGTVVEDIAGNGMRDGDDPGLAGWAVFLDANGNGIWDGTVKTREVTAPMPLHDVRAPQYSNMRVTGVGVFSHVTVALDIDHTFIADLDAVLIAPSGKRIALFSGVGGSGDGMNVVLDQDAFAGIVSAPNGEIAGTWRPDGNLAHLYGSNANGTWRLEITDTAEGDSGTLNGWSLTFGVGERMTTSDADGNYRFSNVAPGTYEVRQVERDGWEQELSGGGVTVGTTSNITGRNLLARQTTGTIRGTVYNDYNANGQRDPGEPGLEGWTVYLDINANGVLDTNEPSTLTDSFGNYEFTNLPSGTYLVRQVIQPGFIQTAPGAMLRAGDGGGDGFDGRGEGGGGADGAGDDGWMPLEERPFTATEVVVAFHGQGQPQLRSSLQQDAVLASWVDEPASQEIFSVRGTTLVEVKLQPGADPLKVVNAFEQRANVAWAEPTYIYDEISPLEFTPNDPLYPQQYHHPLMQNNLAWDITLGDPDLIVAVTDNGFLLNHPDLQGAWVPGWNFIQNNNDPSPASSGHDHGTHVAGIFGAHTDNGIGVAGTSGGVRIMPIKFYQGSGSWTATIVANAYAFAADNGASIMVTSYNVDGFSNNQTFIAGLDYMYDAGVLHFNSAGNNNQLNPSRARHDHSMFVASTNSNDVRAGSSNYGWGIDIAAPGVNVLSTSIGSGFSAIYETKSGTSMAAPNAAGTAALIWSANPSWTREQVAAQMVGTADNIDAQNPNFVGLLGAGRVNSFRGVTENIAPPTLSNLVGLPAEGAQVASAPGSFRIDNDNVFDPATMNTSNFEMRYAGIDGVFGTVHDELIPLSVVFGLHGAPDFKVGTNRLFFSINGTMPPGEYRFSALPTLTDPFGQPLDGSGDGVGGDAFTRHFTIVAVSTPHVVTVGPGQTVTGIDFGNHDIVPPQVLASDFLFQHFHALSFTFNEGMSSFSPGHLALLNTTTGQSIDTSGFAVNWNAATNTATFQAPGILPDGNYVATLSGSVTDLSGNPLQGGDYTHQFFFVQADPTRDGIVDLADLLVVRGNFGQTGVGFSGGDVNYDGVVDLADLLIVRGNFGFVLGGGGGNGEGGGSLFGDGGGGGSLFRNGGGGGSLFGDGPRIGVGGDLFDDDDEGRGGNGVLRL